MFIIPNVIRGLSHILQFSARGFPASILVIAMCLFISSNIIRGFLSSCYRFSAREFLREYSCDCFVFVHYPEYYSGFIIFLCLLSTTFTKQQGFALPNYQSPITNYQLPITNYQLPHRVPKSKPGASFQRNGRSGIRLGR